MGSVFAEKPPQTFVELFAGVSPQGVEADAGEENGEYGAQHSQ